MMIFNITGVLLTEIVTIPMWSAIKQEIDLNPISG